MKYGVTKPESELMQRVQQGDERALASLMEMFYDPLYNYASRFTSDNGLIRDCIQEIFISLWQRRETANGILCPKFYFLRAVKNKLLKAMHKNLRRPFFADASGDYEFSIEQLRIEKQVSEERAARVRETLALLTGKQKEIIYLKYYLYLDHEQIAELMSLNRQSVYNLLHEALHRLRLLLKIELVNQ